MTSLPILGALIGAVLWWFRRRARKAEERAAKEERRADVAVATHEADRAVEARKAEAHERAEAAIPTPDVTQPAAVVVGEIDDAFRRTVDPETQRRAAERVRARIAAPRRKG